MLKIMLFENEKNYVKTVWQITVKLVFNKHAVNHPYSHFTADMCNKRYDYGQKWSSVTQTSIFDSFS